MDSVKFVILSEAKDLLSLAPTRKQILRMTVSVRLGTDS
jgi:hypothetical protein